METGNNVAPQLVLYKLHGSINWKRSPETKELFCVEQIESVIAEKDGSHLRARIQAGGRRSLSCSSLINSGISRW